MQFDFTLKNKHYIKPCQLNNYFVIIIYTSA